MKYLKLSKSDLYKGDQKFLNLGFVQEILQIKTGIPMVSDYAICNVQFNISLNKNKTVNSVSAEFEVDPKYLKIVADITKQVIAADAYYIRDMDILNNKIVCFSTGNHISVLDNDNFFARNVDLIKSFRLRKKLKKVFNLSSLS